MLGQGTSKIVLGIIIAIAACLAIVFDFEEEKQLFRVFKPLTTFLIILFVVSFGNRRTVLYKWVLLGLVLCLVGDSLLLFESYFIWGLVAFLIAHIFFAVGFTKIGGTKFFTVSLIPLLAFGAIYYWQLFAHLGPLAVPVLCYFLIIIFMSWQGINLRIWKKNRMTKLISFAVILFLVSDAVLAWAKFKEPIRYSGVLILGTYWMSIFLIAVATSSTEIDEHK